VGSLLRCKRDEHCCIECYKNAETDEDRALSAKKAVPWHSFFVLKVLSVIAQLENLAFYIFHGRTDCHADFKS